MQVLGSTTAYLKKKVVQRLLFLQMKLHVIWWTVSSVKGGEMKKKKGKFLMLQKKRDTQEDLQ